MKLVKYLEIFYRRLRASQDCIKEERKMKDIPGYEGLYAVTSCGRVWSYKSKRFLNPIVNNNNYLVVTLHKDGERKIFLIHRLVAEAYIPNPNSLDTVDHIDNNKMHNYVNNLQWLTRAENTRKESYLREKKIKCIETGEVFPSILAAAKATSQKTSSHIGECCNGKRRSAGGYHWHFIE